MYVLLLANCSVSSLDSSHTLNVNLHADLKVSLSRCVQNIVVGKATHSCSNNGVESRIKYRPT